MAIYNANTNTAVWRRYVMDKIGDGTNFVGAVVGFAFATDKDGWLYCDGSAVSRTTYADLYAEIGTTYGTGDGSTTFNLPDYRGQFLRGQDDGEGVDPDAASRTDRGDGTTGDVVGSKQGHALQNHNHKAQIEATGSISGTGYQVASSKGSPPGNDGIIELIGDVGTIASETRPINVGVRYYICAVGDNYATVTAPAGVTDVFINGVKQAATSGTEIDFSIPSGVKKVVVTGYVVSTSGSDNIVFQIGDATSVKTSGYGSAASYVGPSAVVTTNYGAGLHIRGSSAGAPYDFTVTWVLHDAATNTWVGNMIGNWTTTNYTFLASGAMALDSELTTVRMTSAAGSVTFDAGSINVQYDNTEIDSGSSILSGSVVQTVHTQDGEVATGTTVMPHDDTIPQITEGIEFLTASITPTSTTNKLKIEVVCGVSSSVASWMTAALFQDSTAGALAAQTDYRNTVNEHRPVVFTYWMTAGTSSSTTFSVRAGGDLAGTTTFNGNSSVRRFGGVSASSITITEYAA